MSAINIRLLNDYKFHLHFVNDKALLSSELLKWSHIFSRTSMIEDECQSPIFSFGYAAHNGPHTWKTFYPESTGYNQSPINITRTIAIGDYDNIEWVGHDTVPCSMIMANDGNSGTSSEMPDSIILTNRETRCKLQREVYNSYSLWYLVWPCTSLRQRRPFNRYIQFSFDDVPLGPIGQRRKRAYNQPRPLCDGIAIHSRQTWLLFTSPGSFTRCKGRSRHRVLVL